MNKRHALLNQCSAPPPHTSMFQRSLSRLCDPQTTWTETARVKGGKKKKIKEGDFWFWCATVGCSSSVRAAEGSACDSPHSGDGCLISKGLDGGGGGWSMRSTDWEREIGGPERTPALNGTA